MNSDDLIYAGILLFSILFGYGFQHISDQTVRKYVSTTVGFVIILSVTKYQVFHPILMTTMCAFALNIGSKKSCHIVSFAIGFGYLLFFRILDYFGLQQSNGHSNLILMMLALKLVGLTFEVLDSSATKLKLKNGESITEQQRYKMIPEVGVTDVFHYSFCYVGVLTGPYYTYRTYCDMLELPAIKNIYACVKASLNAFRFVPIYLALTLLTMKIFPLEALTTDEFYDHSFLYRMWYVYPVFFIFRTRIYVGLRLSEIVCMMAGLGLYPVDTKPKLGDGPTENFNRLQNKNANDSEEYSFETINSVDIYGSEFSLTVKEAVRHWNRTVQYWLATFVYRRVRYKKIRTLCTFFVSSFWHGLYAGYYFSLFSVPFYLAVEDRFKRRLKNTKVNNFILWMSKMFQLSYWGLAFTMKETAIIWRYAVSIYFTPYIISSVIYGISFYL